MIPLYKHPGTVGHKVSGSKRSRSWPAKETRPITATLLSD